MSAINPSDWLKALGALCAGTMTTDEASAKIRAYLPLLHGEYPPEAFTAESLKAVARECKFFPAYGELAVHLTAWWKENRPASQRFAALPSPEPVHRALPTEAEKIAQAETMAAFMASRKSEVTACAREVKPKYLSPDQLRAAYSAQGREAHMPPYLK